MSWQEREYNWQGDNPGPWRDWKARLPTRAAGTLIAIQFLGALLYSLLYYEQNASQQQVTSWFRLSFTQTNPVAILLHPLGTGFSYLIPAIAVIWTLGSKLDDTMGSRKLWWLYVIGNLMGGATFFAIATAAPVAAVTPLMFPIGGFAAWCLSAWRLLQMDFVPVFGRFFAASKITGAIALIVVAAVAIPDPIGSVAWLAAILSGAAAVLVIDGVWQLAERRKQPTGQKSVRRVRPSVVHDEDDFDSVDTDDSWKIESRAPRSDDDLELDRLLAKISREGMRSLTDDERAKLEAARQAKLRGNQTERVR